MSTNESAKRYTAEEKQVARQAIAYLEEHGFCLSWEFNDLHPPTESVRTFLTDFMEDLFDSPGFVGDIIETAIGAIDLEFGEDEEAKA